MLDQLTMTMWIWIFLGPLIGAAIGQTKGRAGAGFFFGLLLGPIGWLIVAVGPDYSPKPVVTVHQSAPAQPPVPVADELSKLADLVKSGVLTPEEFQQQKSKLLGSNPHASGPSSEPLAARRPDPPPSHPRPCPYCNKEIAAEATRCRWCLKEVG